MNPSESQDCVVYRCSKQSEMYLYVRSDYELEDLPEGLKSQMGRLTQVMELTLTHQRKLARVDVQAVISQLKNTGYFLQMPPPDLVKPDLYWGD